MNELMSIGPNRICFRLWVKINAFVKYQIKVQYIYLFKKHDMLQPATFSCRCWQHVAQICGPRHVTEKVAVGNLFFKIFSQDLQETIENVLV